MPHGRRHGKPAGTARRVHGRDGAAGGLWVALALDRATNIDEVVGKHPKSDPAFDADIASISAAVETVPPLGDADSPLAAGAPDEVPGGPLIDRYCPGSARQGPVEPGQAQ